ncbi:N-alpha-acetyltransferase 16, NatA auxiliary subunit [Orchesella cincta]|uniref:N-alpha-acetyltransferase 16, NatA auxiliary subunit n=1 Tax=Orchesella cincta TaxID=48709 RepID=A0A1D2N7D0_ORCCI|nr:N-alpha-acetyltransferase 16, NatA auxiliary subunit [Orchesella cincta]
MTPNPVTVKSLPPKENALFKRILKCYEQKLYKNGLKFAKQILSNPQFADHAETLAMKGLILNALGRREEAYEYVRRGLRNDLKSHTCWHVFGLLQRSERKYDEAIKCYRNALKWDSQNIQILRELSIVQIHTRDLVGYRDTRHQLFKLKPGQRASWIGFAIAYHLMKDYEMAFKILDALRNTMNQDNQQMQQGRKDATFEYERSELLLYQNMILEESGDILGAKKHLLDHNKEIIDRVAFNETIARYHIHLEEYVQAETIYRKLIQSNQENKVYYEGLMRSLRIEEEPEEKSKLFNELKAQYPRAALVKRLPLDFTEEAQFTDLLRPYVISALEKGAPTLFTDLRPLYKNPSKVVIIQNLVEGFVTQLEKNSKFSEVDTERAPASGLLWAYYYLAKHYDHIGNTKTALHCVNKAIDHTPTLIELLTCKAKIYKHSGDITAAVENMNDAREMDTADRYLNSKCAKYMLRADKVSEATEILGKFTREGTSPMDNLNEMQCMWFQTECARTYQRVGMWGEALKKCLEVDRHFHEIIEDQYDFHSYCLRKMTLRSYIKLLRLEDILHSHPFYFKAAKVAIDVYIYLHDNPLKNQSSDEQNNQENLSPSELKKLKNKERKAKKRAELEQQAAAAAAEKKNLHQKQKQTNEDGESHHPDSAEELVPDKLAATVEPLQQAMKFLEPLLSLAAHNIETHILAYEIYSRKDKPLLMLRSIRRALKVDPDNDTVQRLLVKFQETMSTRVKTLPEPLPEFMKKELEKVYAFKKIN